MKRPFLITLGIFIVLITGSLILASLKSAQKYRFNVTANDLHAKLVESSHLMRPEEALDLIRSKSEDYVFVDLRDPRSFDNFHIEGAVNVPTQRVLDEEYEDALKSDRKKILYGAETIRANEVWMILTQFGYNNLYVLEGGVDYWRSNVMEKNIFQAKAESSDEKAKYDFKKIIAGDTL
jgi:rhodanese-related sulfurtransferase